MKNNLRNKVISLLLAMFCFITFEYSIGQNAVSFPYVCGFEDPLENSNWILNSSNQLDFCNDRWYIGAATFTDGLHSLYISCDNGNTTNFGFSPNVVVAYREIHFPQSNKNYTFSFDWKNQATIGSGLYFCLIPKSQGIPKSVANTATLGRLLNAAQPMKLSDGTSNKCLRGSASWQTATLSIPIKMQEPMYVVFVWQNDKVDTVFDILGACVDNFQIVNSSCGTPSKLSVKSGCDTVSLQWFGTSSEYLLEYKANTDNVWRSVHIGSSGYSEQNYNIVGLSEGVYDIRIRGVCDKDTSAMLTRVGVPVFCSDNHCINYVGLSDVNTQCYVGNAGGGGFQRCYAEDYDYGQFEMKSRFTTCWIKNQKDPLTEYKLATIPDGEMASVRLGNWNVNKEAERIEYTYFVDSVMPGILILKYAVVLEDPKHMPVEQPFFQLTLLEENGAIELDADCGKAQFSADRNLKGWQTASPYSGDKQRVITWKDWTTMGINLDKYRGKTIIIRLTTQDCLQGAHFGYAYFTLGCEKGMIESISCGAQEDQYIEAPIGFDYQWFKKYDDDSNPLQVLSTDSVFKVPLSDTDPYYVRCTYKEKDMAKKGCYFDLSTIVSPRFPFADFVLEHAPSNCENKYRLRNKSHVILDYGDSIVHKKETVQRVEWYLEGGNIVYDDSPVFTAPDIGDTIDVRLVAYIANGDCVDDTVCKVVIPSIYSDTVVVDSIICASDFPFVWQNPAGFYVCGEPGIYYDNQLNYAGCDSVTKLILRSTPQIDNLILDTFICFGDSLAVTDQFDSKYVFKKSVNRDVVLKSTYGCDSVIELHLTVGEEVTFSLSISNIENGNNSGEIIITDAPDKYSYLLNGELNAPLKGLPGGEYEVIVIDSVGCMSKPQTVTIETECLVVEVELPTPFVACADDDSIMIKVDVLAGNSSGYTLEYSDFAKDAGFQDVYGQIENGYVKLSIPDSCRPNHYQTKLILHDYVCPDTSVTVKFDVLYSSSIIGQKWNDVLAIFNQTYNGGYTFSEYQWFVNDKPIAGANFSYYYVPNNVMIDTSSYYHVNLTRTDDGVTIPSCPFKPDIHKDVADFPAIIQQANLLQITMPDYKSVEIFVYDYLGRLFMSEKFKGNIEIDLSNQSGPYLLVFVSDDGLPIVRKVHL